LAADFFFAAFFLATGFFFAGIKLFLAEKQRALIPESYQ
jgi:hypothetical protein